MELVYLDSRSELPDEGAIPEFSGRSEEGQDPSTASSEAQSDLGQINCKQPLPSDEKKSRSCQSCHKSLCSCSTDLPHSDLFPALPAKMVILEFLIRSLRHPTRTHNVSDLDDLIANGASKGNINLGPSEKMVLDSLHALVDAKTRPKSPSFFLSGAKMRKTRSKSHIITQSEILKLMTPETWEISPGASPLKPCTSELSMHEKMLPSCSHPASMLSNQPNLSHCPASLSAGLLQCIWKDGLPHFELSIDNPFVVYTANPFKVPRDSDNALDYVYMFHSGEQGRKDWTGHSSNVSRLVGKMKVSSSLVLNSDNSSLVETEFVLYGSFDDYLRQMHSSYSTPKGKGLVKRVAEIMRPGNVSSSPRHVWKFGKPSSHQFDGMTETLNGEMVSARDLALTNLDADDLPANQELAAIVVREHRHQRQKEPVRGGWGLKFLEKAGLSLSEGTEDVNVQNRTDAAKSITVVVPRGYHGGAASKDGGPAGLIERWRSGGRCDCGGWDLGCPIRVLNNDGWPSLHEAVSHDNKSVELSVKGAQKNETLLRLVNVTEDLYILYFGSSLSPLQCFSTGIAIVHSQAPQLCPKL